MGVIYITFRIEHVCFHLFKIGTTFTTFEFMISVFCILKVGKEKNKTDFLVVLGFLGLKLCTVTFYHKTHPLDFSFNSFIGYFLGS